MDASGVTFISRWGSLLGGLNRQVICVCVSPGVVAVECLANPIADEHPLQENNSIWSSSHKNIV